MALKLYSDTDIQAIADAIRAKNGTSDTYTVAQMAAAVRSISGEGGGEGLPSGISAVSAGSYTPASTMTTDVTMNHGLGVVPDLIVVYSPDFTFGASNQSGEAQALVGVMAIIDGVTSSMGYRDIVLHKNTNGGWTAPAYTGTSYGIGDLPTTTSFTIKCASSYKMLAGKTYKWIAVKFAF